MQLKILTFGITRDIIGTSQLLVEVDKPLSVEELRSRLKEQYPAMKKLASLAIAVNSEYVDEDIILQEKDEIALIPPVSGG